MNTKKNKYKEFINTYLFSLITIITISSIYLITIFSTEAGNLVYLVYNQIKLSFSFVLGHFSQFILELSNKNVEYFHQNQTLIETDGKELNINSVLGFRYYIFAIIVSFFFNKNYKKFGLYFLISFIALSLITIIRSSIDFFNIGIFNHQFHDAFHHLKLTIIISLFYFRIKYIFGNTNVFLKTKESINERFIFSLFGIIWIIPIFINMHKFIDLWTISGNFSILLGVIQYMSHYILEFLGHETNIINNCIYLNINYVCIGYNCLGIGIIISFSVLILLIRSNWINKLIYISIGIIVMIIMNSIRVVYLLLHLYKHQSYELAMDAHDLSNYFFYVVVFLLFLGYILWFQYLPIFRGKVER